MSTLSDTTVPNGHLIDSRLRIRLTMFLLISLVLMGFIIYDLADRVITPLTAGIALVTGLVIGYGLGRSVYVRWHETEEKVVTQMDTVGMLAIGAYIVFALLRHKLLGEWLTGIALTGATLTLVAGLLFGRYLGMRYSIQKVVRKNMPSEERTS